jgi:hypothetical protein
MVLIVVLVTTFATAQEAVKQYDGLREQANEWATSTLLSSLLNTAAPEEELVQAQLTAVTSSSCSAAERSDEPAQQPATQTASHQVETKSAALQHRDEAIRIAVNESPAPVDTQHIELSEAGREALDSINVIALLTDKDHGAELESLSQPEGMEEPESAPVDHDEDADSDAHAKPELHFINRVITETSPRLSEADINAIRARAASDALVQIRAARRAVKVLQERAGRPIRVELKLIKKGDQQSGAGVAPLRAAQSAPRLDAADTPDALPAPPALQQPAATSANGACASE